MRAEPLVIDTSVLVEYIDEESPFAEKIECLFSAIKKGEITAYITTVTAAEVIYVASRIYMEAGSSDPNSDAALYLDWLIGDVGIRVVQPIVEDATMAGELRKKFRIALPDCFVIAVAKRLGGKALFLKVEMEMNEKVEEFEKLDVAFLEEFDFNLKTPKGNNEAGRSVGG